MGSSAMPLAFLALSVLAVGMRDEEALGEKLLSDSRDPPGGASISDNVGNEASGLGNIDIDENEDLLIKFVKDIKDRKNNGVTTKAYIGLMFSDTSGIYKKCRESDTTKGTFTQEEWQCVMRIMQWKKSDADKLFHLLWVVGKKSVNYHKDPMITKDQASHCFLDKVSRDDPEKKKVLKAVWTKITGSENGELFEGNLTCSNDPAGFIDHIKEESGATSLPLTFADFENYYFNLGELLNSELFVLMVVNAWHFMDDPYEKVNTVNLRVRGTEADGTNELYVLKDDCGKKADDVETEKRALIKERLQKQLNKNFTKIQF